MHRTILLALLAVLASCFGGQASNPFAGVGGAPSQVTIDVRNDSYSEATLHLYRGGERSRLGVVGALDENTFTLAWRRTLDMQILIDLLAGPSCLTRELPVDPGDIVQLTITNQLDRDIDCVRVMRP